MLALKKLLEMETWEVSIEVERRSRLGLAGAMLGVVRSDLRSGKLAEHLFLILHCS